MTIKKRVVPAPSPRLSPVSAEQGAAIRFMGELRAAGLDGASASIDDSMLVPTLAAAGLVGVKRQTLATWRTDRRCDLQHVQVGRRVFYRYGDIRRFIERNIVKPRAAA